MCPSCDYYTDWHEAYETEHAEKEAQTNRLRKETASYNTVMTRTANSYTPEKLDPTQGPATPPLHNIGDTVIIDDHSSYRATIIDRQWAGMTWWYNTQTGGRASNRMISLPENRIHATEPVELVVWNRTDKPANVWA